MSIIGQQLAPAGSDLSCYPRLLRLSEGADDSVEGVGHTSAQLIPGMRPRLVRIQSNPQGAGGNFRISAGCMAAMRSACAEVVGFAQHGDPLNSTSSANIIENAFFQDAFEPLEAAPSIRPRLRIE